MNYCNELLTKRANTTTHWLYEKEEYQYVHNVRQGLIPYLGPTDIEYKFNSHGFRCDEFNLDSELPIVFLGCSQTEGLGLPLEDMWSYNLVRILRIKTKKLIPYWNLALTGSGIDTQARFLYEFCKEKQIKYVFALMPTLERREYCFNGPDIKLWNPYMLAKESFVNKVFADEHYAYHETGRSLMLLDSICRKNNAKCFMSQWTNAEPNVNLLQDFTSINYFKTEVKEIDLARDMVHYGPKFNLTFTTKMLSVLGNYESHI